MHADLGCALGGKRIGLSPPHTYPRHPKVTGYIHYASVAVMRPCGTE